MTGLKDYDLDIKLVDTVKGHGLCRLAAKAIHAREEEEELVGWDQEIKMYDVERALPTACKNSWYEDVRHVKIYESNKLEILLQQTDLHYLLVFFILTSYFHNYSENINADTLKPTLIYRSSTEK